MPVGLEQWWIKQLTLRSRTLALCATTALAAATQAFAQTPARVVSANLCADQLTLALADPGQIMSLGPFARDRGLSFLAEAAKKYPGNRGGAEEMIGLKADLVLLGSFDSRYARAVLAGQKIAFMSLQPWSNLEQGRQQIRDVAQRLGHAERGEKLIGEIDAEIARLAVHSKVLTRNVRALVLHRRGYALHSGVISELAGIAGIANPAEKLGIRDSGLVPLERIIAEPPDYLIVAQEEAPPSDQGQAFLAHPALMRLFPAAKRLVVPDQLTICAGPATPALIRHLAGEIAAKVR